MRILTWIVLLMIVAIFMPVLAMAGHSASSCTNCHAPHNAYAGGPPLWSGRATTNTFTVYTSNTLDAAPGQPDGASKLCLSCHDRVSTSSRYFGTDLRKMHPISFVYDTTLSTKDAHLKDPATAISIMGGTLSKDYLDSNGKIQCTSCHDVHSTGIGSSWTRGADYSLDGDNVTLCRQCHLK